MKNCLRVLYISLAFIIIWQTIVKIWQIPSYLLPSPSQVFLALYQYHAILISQTGTTLLEITIGFLLGISLGCIAGVMISYFKTLHFWFWPLLIISQAIPTFAIAPLLVIWLGYGLASKIAVIVLMIFFPVASALHDGLQRTPTEWLHLAHTMNASSWRLFWYIRIPAALPALASDVRIAAATAPIGAILGEWVGASRGLGYLMLNANARMQIDMMFAALIVIIMLALFLYFSIDKFLDKYVTWSI